MAYNKNVPYNDLPDLPPQLDAETRELLLTHALRAARSLGELKGLCDTMTKDALMNLLVNTIVLQESRDSSAIENIVTTQDELYKAVAGENLVNPAAKEVLSYREALYAAGRFMQEHHNLITTNLMVHTVQVINHNDAGVRNQPGTALLNAVTGETVHTPPCCEDVIREKLSALETFINDSDFCNLDPIIKLALMHYQFETIHPFTDGNGRTGRILNMLYLMQQQLLPQPVLYLSFYIVEHKQDYYRLLREVTEQNNWRDWVLFMTTAIHTTAQLTMKKIRGILDLKKEIEPEAMIVLEKFINRNALFDLMFTLPYLKIDLLVKRGIAHRETASIYLRKLEEAGLLRSKKMGRTTYYLNFRLMDLLIQR
jgi:Fic family protein